MIINPSTFVGTGHGRAQFEEVRVNQICFRDHAIDKNPHITYKNDRRNSGGTLRQKFYLIDI